MKKIFGNIVVHVFSYFYREKSFLVQIVYAMIVINITKKIVRFFVCTFYRKNLRVGL